MELLPNPVVLQRADPCILRWNSMYYFTGSYPTYDRIILRKASKISDLQDADERVIWEKHSSDQEDGMSELIWAPEIHRINGQWIIYFAAAPTTEVSEISHTFQHRIYCLACEDDDPVNGTWQEKGKVDTGMDTFCLDATTFIGNNGEQYLVWAQKDLSIDGNSNLYIARMATPWKLETAPVMLSQPDLEWERIRFTVEEGPAALIHDGSIFLTYSASGTGPEYAMGMLGARMEDDLLDPSSWTKSPDPVFTSNLSVRKFGPGHNSFTTTPDGKDLLIYHCRNYTEINGDPLFDPNRHACVGQIVWKDDGTPDFGTPLMDTRWTPSTTEVLPPDGKLLVNNNI